MRTHLTTEKAIWYHQKLVILQQQDLSIRVQLKHKKTKINNFMKIIEALKEEIKNSVKEME